MKIKDIIWLENIVEKIDVKHGVQIEEVEEVFHNSPKFRYIEKGSRSKEDVYAAYGVADSGRKLIVIFIHKLDGNIIILSAREMTNSERKLYERK